MRGATSRAALPASCSVAHREVLMLPNTIESQIDGGAISDAGTGGRALGPADSDPAVPDFHEFGAGTVDALTSGIAILDQYGTIIAVNRVWREFARLNGLRLPRAGVGANYLTVCDSTVGADAATAQAAAARIRAVLDGSAAEPTLEYAMESTQGPRWYAMRATRFAGAGPGRVVVGHEEITRRRHANDELRRER